MRDAFEHGDGRARDCLRRLARPGALIRAAPSAASWLRPSFRRCCDSGGLWPLLAALKWPTTIAGPRLASDMRCYGATIEAWRGSYLLRV
jgi:hypothetical protein